jgi:hypothetical protein
VEAIGAENFWELSGKSARKPVGEPVHKAPSRVQAHSPTGSARSTTTRQRATSHGDGDWRRIRNRFPQSLDALARSAKVMTFWRAVPSAESLLRMLLLWALTGFGLRSVAGWAARSGWAQLTDDALRYRFRRCEDFLMHVLAHVLQQWLQVARTDGMPLRIVDASMLAIPGPSGRCLRVHAVFDPRCGRMTSVELTDDKQGENASRGPHQARDLVIADRGLAHAKPLALLCLRKVLWLVRVYLNTWKLHDALGNRLDVSVCDQADQASGPIERDVWFAHDGRLHHARLVVTALPADKAQAARDRFLKRASKKQKKNPDPAALRMAGYVMLLTTIPRATASAASVLQWYRVRWQIELFFKRCKSLLNLHTVVSACAQLQRVRVLSSLLVASLVDQLNAPALEASDPSRRSLWRWTQLHSLDLLRAVSGNTSMEKRLRSHGEVQSKIQERPRKRHRTNAAALLDAIPEQVPHAA